MRRSSRWSPLRSAGSWLNMMVDFFQVIARNRALVVVLMRRDINSGYAGHGLGAIWAYTQPLVIVTAFIAIFGVVLGARLTVTSAFPGDYTSYLLTGLVPWLWMAYALGRSGTAFSSNAAIVKQVVFPLETLPVAGSLTGLLIYMPAVAVMVVYKASLGGGLTLMVLLLPIILFLQFLLVVGLTLLLSVITPFLRDLREVVVVYMSISLYFTPAIYLPDWVPRSFRPILYLNPFSYAVWVYQDTVFFGAFRHPWAWIVFSLLAVGTFSFGLLLFRRVRPFLGNVL